MRATFAVVVAALVGAILLVAIGIGAPPPAPTCAEEMDEVACTSAVGAVARRGLPAIHPLILATRVEPGPESGPQQYGHRATVAFDMLGLPGPVSIELHYDSGAHWGGRLDRSEGDLVAWALAPLALAALLAAVLLGLSWRRQRATATTA